MEGIPLEPAFGEERGKALVVFWYARPQLVARPLPVRGAGAPA